ncbi:hypothetical protein [Nonomuraea sp. NPDC048916]|uniref:hypothetical protein n=1 Tax=Nonomuraea sp. NPDC048916 TaxID=3154232 RepID=UPI0033D5B853
MRRALCAAIIAMAALGGTAAMSAPAFATPTPDDPLIITSDQLTPVLDCDRPVTLLKDDRGRVVQRKHDECREPERVECLAGPGRHRHGGTWQVRYRDERGIVRVRGFEHRDDAARFAKKGKRVIKLIDCAHHHR